MTDISSYPQLTPKSNKKTHLLNPLAIEQTEANRVFLGNKQIALLCYMDHNRSAFIHFIKKMKDSTTGKSIACLLHSALNTKVVNQKIAELLNDYSLIPTSEFYSRYPWDDYFEDINIPLSWIINKNKKENETYMPEDIHIPEPRTIQDVILLLANIYYNKDGTFNLDEILVDEFQNRISMIKGGLCIRFIYNGINYIVCETYSRLDYRYMSSLLKEKKKEKEPVVVYSGIVGRATIDYNQLPSLNWTVHHSVLLEGIDNYASNIEITKEWINGEWKIQEETIVCPSSFQDVLYCMFQNNLPDLSLYNAT